MQRGIATFTLDTGVCPPWLFRRMVSLGREIAILMVDEYGPEEFIKRIGDPVWFQSLGTVLAFDWNASGLTTILTASLKESIKGLEKDLGIFICGGKGKTSRRTPEEIVSWSEIGNIDSKDLIKASRLAAKVDSSMVQDNYELYHHAFFFTKTGAWTVVQQGMDKNTSTARRYHWHSAGPKDFVNEPHAGISAQLFKDNILNLTAGKSKKTRDVSVFLGKLNYKSLIKDVEIIRKYSNNVSKMLSLKKGDEQLTLLKLEDIEFRHHKVEVEDFSKSRYLEKILQKVTWEKPSDYETLLATEGVGGKTLRALSLISEIIYGAAPSYEDPARYSFAHGGKDATPYPVDKPTYDKSIEIMKKAVKNSKIGYLEKEKALKRAENLQRLSSSVSY